ncbi:MAG TPA: hypothetical protein VKE98_05805 [Gemmataceae bacterium]|nr:hypothetical protein [Gemmataceae bacterium]
MSIGELTAVVRPPSNPLETGDCVRWRAVQNELRIALPEDFKDLGLLYGTGYFGSDHWSLKVANPFAPVFVERVRADCEFLHEFKDTVEGEVPYSIFPDCPGLFLWGQDDNGYIFCWLTEGQPNHWPTLITNIRSVWFERIELPITSLLARGFSGEMDCIAWKTVPPMPGTNKVRFSPGIG